MPKLGDFRSTKILTLPSFPDSKVEIYDSLLVGQIKNINYDEKNLIKLGVETLPYFIKSWNFTDTQDKDMEITQANLDFLKEADVMFLVAEIEKFGKESKKKETD